MLQQPLIKEKSGPKILYFEDGQEKARLNYKNNLFEGKIIYFHKNGKLEHG